MFRSGLSVLIPVLIPLPSVSSEKLKLSMWMAFMFPAGPVVNSAKAESITVP